MAVSENELWILSFYRTSEISGSLFFGRLAKSLTSPLVQADMTKHFADESMHAWYWTECIRRLGEKPIKVDAAAVERGRAAAAACVACHGPAGKGDLAKGVPDLTGQPPGYLKNQMLLFKADKRSPGDPALKELKAVMRPIPEATLADLAAYYSSLR